MKEYDDDEIVVCIKMHLESMERKTKNYRASGLRINSMSFLHQASFLRPFVPQWEATLIELDHPHYICGRERERESE